VSLCTLVRVKTTRGRSSISCARVSSSMRSLPSKAMRLTIGFSSTITTSTLPSRSRRTSAKRPVAKRFFRESSRRTGSKGSPGLTRM